MTSLVPMPSAQARTAAALHAALRPARAPSARIAQYSVSRKNSDISDSTRWTM